MLALLSTEMDKNAHCHRYESIRCYSCMSQAHTSPSQQPSASDQPHSSRHSLHLVNSFKKSFDYCLLEIVAFFNLMSTAQAKPNGPDSCKKCRRLRVAHKLNCIDCQTKRNTKRNTLLGLELLPDTNRSKEAREEEGCSQAFVDHLLHLDSSQLTHNKRGGGVETRLSKKAINTRRSKTNTPELLQVINVPHSQSLTALKPAIEIQSVSTQQRPHSDGSYSTVEPIKSFEAARCSRAWGQFTQSTIPLTTPPRATRNDSLASSQSHAPQQGFRTSLGGDSDLGHSDAPIETSSRLEITSNFSETGLDTRSRSASISPASFSFPSASQSSSFSSKYQCDRPLEHKQSYLSSSSYPRAPNLTHSTSFLSHESIEECSRGDSSKHADIDQYGFENPAFQD